jgi:putative tryptophan/tyrosine transport system substrate-binding protein
LHTLRVLAIAEEVVMRRRDIMAGLLVAAAFGRAQAQPTATKIPRIGYLGTNIGPASLPPIEAFREGLRQLGYIEGQNIVVEYRWAIGEADQLAAAKAAELVRLDLDLIVAANTTYIPSLRQAGNTVPTVFCISGDPVAEGIVASLARPGGNVTGIAAFGPELGVKQLEILTEAVPSARRIAILWDPTYEQHKVAMPAIEAAAQKLAVTLQLVPARTADEFDAAFAAMDRAHAEAVLALASSLTYSNRARLGELARQHRLPSILLRGAGGLLSYTPNIKALFRQCADYVDKILKGAKPSDLPVEEATKFDLIVNLKIAKMLGITIPPSLLARADEVIE